MYDTPVRPVERGYVALAVTGAVLDLVGAASFGLIRFFGSSPPERGRAGVLATAVFAGALALPGIAALIGLRGRPIVVIAAGAMILPLSCLSIVTPPMQVPAILLMVAGARFDRALGGPVGREILAGACIVAFGIAAVVALYATQDPAEWSTAREQGSTSDIITTREAVTGAGFLAAAIVAPLLVPPRERTRNSL
jgi:hypothetical protein